MTSIVLGGHINVLTNHVMNMVLPNWSMGASCGSFTGIPLGGFVAEHLSWRAAFYLIRPA
jgi:predicted MFS family arabinose efflux permease